MLVCRIRGQCHRSDRNAPELRINDQDQTWRIVYHVASDAIVILDVFSKKIAATPKDILSNCKKRLAAFVNAVVGGERKRE